MQKTLDRASKGRTTIIVSHRMSAIKNADRIVFIDKGKVVEDGTHSELIALNGRYYDMVKSTHEDLERSNELDVDEEIISEFETKCLNRQFSYEISPEVTEEDSIQDKDTVKYWSSIKRLSSLIRSDWITMTIAVTSSIVLGFSLPLFSVIFSEAFAVS